MTPLHVWVKIGLLALVAAAALTDWRTRHIPNPLTVAGMVAGIGLHAWLGFGTNPWAGLLGALVGFAVQAPFFYLGKIGGGDVKLMTAVGAFTGPGNFLVVFIYSAVLEGMWALGAMIFKKDRTGLPRGPFVLVGTMLFLYGLI